MEEKKPFVVILGGTSGLGAAIADEYLLRGRGVLVLGTRGQEYDHDVGDIPTPWQSTQPAWPPVMDGKVSLYVNLASIDKTERAANLTLSLIKNVQIEAVVWAAGAVSRAGFLESAGAQLVDINLRNPLVYMNKLFRELVVTRKSPFSLVVISSTTGISTTPKPEEAVYAATKAAQVSFARALGRETDNRGMKVALFCPGGMRTEFWRNEPSVDTSSFLDPNKVAAAIVDDVTKQAEPYYERTIPRGSL